jgi:hypothetical protein
VALTSLCQQQVVARCGMRWLWVLQLAVLQQLGVELHQDVEGALLVEAGVGVEVDVEVEVGVVVGV